jgi:hypothetical protein
MKWIAAVIVIGAVLVSATIFLTRASGPEVFETEFAQEALSHVDTGWRCEAFTNDGTYEPVGTFVLEVTAKVEKETGSILQRGHKESWSEPNYRCTREVT